MTTDIRNQLMFVWAFLVAITIASWWISGNVDGAFKIDQTITLSVLSIAAIKSRLVIRYFMEVRYAPSWLKRTCDGWLVVVFLMIFGFYWSAT